MKVPYAMKLLGDLVVLGMLVGGLEASCAPARGAGKASGYEVVIGIYSAAQGHGGFRSYRDVIHIGGFTDRDACWAAAGAATITPRADPVTLSRDLMDAVCVQVNL